ncbi:hypothetical protein ACFOTA_12340 [Chitinophaga sp. GCM10012297]|uniref:Uncharacterized protein n=1 Tax=Chitinophaga chungangae TaxID=2821488 RepID=A0ABS3YE88_9BACT|nr:hypothetical protein [Chitinophaga chungangae]MBO9153000.1 hypothetical protein [Chitinophaga chungangae]
MKQTKSHQGEARPCSPKCLVHHDHTELVTTLLKIDNSADKKDPLLLGELDTPRETNLYAYHFHSGDEVTEIPETQYFAQLDEWRRRQNELSRTGKERYLTYAQNKAATEELAALERKITSYEAAESVQRQVYSWWSVSYWLGEELAQKGEVILRIYGCTWWGITNLQVPHPSAAAVLHEIYEETNCSIFENQAPWEE